MVKLEINKTYKFKVILDENRILTPYEPHGIINIYSDETIDCYYQSIGRYRPSATQYLKNGTFIATIQAKISKLDSKKTNKNIFYNRIIVYKDSIKFI